MPFFVFNFIRISNIIKIRMRKFMQYIMYYLNRISIKKQTLTINITIKRISTYKSKILIYKHNFKHV